MSYHNYNPFAPKPPPAWSQSAFMRHQISHSGAGLALNSANQHLGQQEERSPVRDLMSACEELVPEFHGLVCEAMGKTGSPAEVVMQTLWCAASAASQGPYDVLSHTGRTSPLGIYSVGYGDSGIGKTSGERFSFGPFYEFEVEQSKKAEVSRREQEVEYKSWASKVRGLDRRVANLKAKGEDAQEADGELKELLRQEPARPKSYRFVYSRITPATLQDASAEVPSVVIATSESENLFNGYGLRDLSLLNEMWDGDPLGSSGRERVPRPRLAMCALGQPVVGQRFAARRGAQARDMGFYARTLIVNVEGDGYRVGAVSDFSVHTEAYQTRIKALLQETQEVALCTRKPCVIELNPSAAYLLRDMDRMIAGMKSPSGRFFEAKDLAAKLPVNILRLAGSLSLLLGKDHIEERVLRFSAIYADLCAEQFLSFFSPKGSRAGLAEDLVRTIDKARAKNPGGRIYRSHLLTNGCGNIRSQALLDEAIDALDPEYRRHYFVDGRKGYFQF